MHTLRSKAACVSSSTQFLTSWAELGKLIIPNISMPLSSHLSSGQENNYDAVLCDMGSELAESKAYLLKKKEEWFGGGSVFDAFVL